MVFLELVLLFTEAKVEKKQYGAREFGILLLTIGEWIVGNSEGKSQIFILINIQRLGKARFYRGFRGF
jgi:hypothetical protein